MASKIFKVISSNENSKKGFVTKIQSETIIKDTIFGDKVKKETYYISGSLQVKEGTEIPESHLFPKFKVQEYEMENPETGEKYMGKWLHVA